MMNKNVCVLFHSLFPFKEDVIQEKLDADDCGFISSLLHKINRFQQQRSVFGCKVFVFRYVDLIIHVPMQQKINSGI